MWKSWPCFLSAVWCCQGERLPFLLQLILCSGINKGETPHPSPHAAERRPGLESRELDNCPCPSPDVSLGRASPAPPLGSIVKLTLLPRGCEYGRAGSKICLLFSDMDEREMPSSTLTPCHLWQVGELVLGSCEQGKLTLILVCYELMQKSKRCLLLLCH